MSIKNSGILSISEIKAEFGGDTTPSLGEYYRAGGRVPADSPGAVPSSGPISISSFYGSADVRVVAYEVIGGGGSGGYGLYDKYSSTSNTPGTASSVAVSGYSTVASAGGGGGLNAYTRPDPPRADNGLASFYGAGGLGGTNHQSETYSPGGAAPSTSYGAGGGGGGGDRSSTFDSSGGAGGGGKAALIRTGSFVLIPGTVITVTIGTGGTSVGGNSPGGRGANGFVRFTVNGVVTNFTTSGTYTVPNT